MKSYCFLLKFLINKMYAKEQNGIEIISFINEAMSKLLSNSAKRHGINENKR